jgi:hypothetical protein
MTRSRISVAILMLLLLGGLVMPVRAQATIQVVSDTASLVFPEKIDFRAGFRAAANITAVVLEYGTAQLTCGTVEAKAFPTFTPGKDVQVDWSWEMRQSTSLAPGASVWWRWQVSDSTGAQFTSPTQTIIWLDSTHPWQVITGGDINLHYYAGGASFGRQLHDAAAKALARLAQDVGLGTELPVDIYIYANANDLKDAVLYEPSWVGGQAFPEDNIVIIGVSPDELDWGMTTEAHELTHVLVGHLTFSCLGFIPTWLNEGLAKYGGGGLQAYEQTTFDQAVASDTLISLRSLTGNFPESDAAYLAYAESYSVVNFLIKTYGRNKMNTLLLDLRDGQTIDDALQAVYGFETDSLEAAWRSSIGAAPHGGSSKATPVSTPTQVPTFVPVGAAPVGAAAVTPPPAARAVTVTPAAAAPATPAVSAPSSTSQPGPSSSRISTSTIIKYALVCLVIALLLAGLAIFIIVRSQKSRVK